MRNLYRKVNDYIPCWCLIIFALTIFSGIIYFLCALFEGFAGFINKASIPIRAITSILSSAFPFSVAEVFIILLPIWTILLVFLAIKLSKKGKKGSSQFLSILFSFFCLYFIFFVWTYASGYHMKPIEEKMELNREELTNEDVYNATIILSNELNSLANEIKYDEKGASIMPYSYKEMSKKITQAYKSFSRETGIVSTFNSRVKPLILSKPMMYTHLSGIYICLTSEANVNTSYPDFIIISSAAHEMAHQRGIAREDEASFIAFLVSRYSDDSFFKYSAYLDVYIDLLIDLKKRDQELYNLAREKIDNRIIDDYNAFSKSFKEYSDSLASDISDKINNTYLQANGDKDGTASYNKVSQLVCAYLISK